MAWDKLVEEEADKRLDQDEVAAPALADAEANGIVFLDEIDKIAVSDVRGGSVSREGVQRDLLPLIEGTTVATKYGPMKTDHILFIASGRVPRRQAERPAARASGPLADPRRTEGPDRGRFRRDPVSDTKASLPEQYKALIGTEGVTIDFTDDGIRAVAKIAAEVNGAIENIGARRLQTVMEKLLEEVSFDAEDRAGSSLVIDAAYVDSQLASIARNTDLSRFVLCNPLPPAGGDIQRSPAIGGERPQRATARRDARPGHHRLPDIAAAQSTEIRFGHQDVAALDTLRSRRRFVDVNQRSLTR